MKTPIESAFRKHLLTLGRQYAKATGLSLSTIGGKCAADGYFFKRLENTDNSINVRTYEKVAGFFASNWPKDVRKHPWPALPAFRVPQPKSR